MTPSLGIPPSMSKDSEPMEAGPAMDALIAERVMGWVDDAKRKPGRGLIGWLKPTGKESQPWVWTGYLSDTVRYARSERGDLIYNDENCPQLAEDCHWDSSIGSQRFAPSTDIAAAWEVVAHLQRKGWFWEILPRPHPENDCEVLLTGRYRPFDDSADFHALETTAPIAICRAAIAWSGGSP